MPTTRSFHGRIALALATAVTLGACADSSPVAPRADAALAASTAQRASDVRDAVLALRQATARYHDLDAAIADGFVFLHGCEVRGDEETVGMVYVHPGRLMDGKIDPASPDALVYEPRTHGAPQLVAAELAMPYAIWSDDAPPSFLGATFQREDEFGVFGLHAWVWRDNPEGLFAEVNPRVSCGAA